MLKTPIYYVNAFTDKLFAGNPAAVCLLPKWLPDNMLQLIAIENNLPVTAFIVKNKNTFSIRWLTPEYELDLCGHGSLSAGYVIFNFLEPNLKAINLESRCDTLQVVYNNNFITLDFPAKSIESCDLDLLESGLGAKPQDMYQHNHERWLAIFNSEEDLKQLKPNIEILKMLPHRGITVTAPGENVDFVSRTFYPLKAIFEDPVTGASHCLLAPYWSNRLNKIDLHALQISARGGELFCRYQNERVLITGKATLYMQGYIELPA